MTPPTNMQKKQMSKNRLYPGAKCPKTGSYRSFTPSGKSTDTVKYVEEGDTMPPTQGKGYYFKWEANTRALV